MSESASSSRAHTLEAGRGLLTASLSLLAQSLALSGHCSPVRRMRVSLDILTARKPEVTGELTSLGAQRRQAPVSGTAAGGGWRVRSAEPGAAVSEQSRVREFIQKRGSLLAQKFRAIKGRDGERKTTPTPRRQGGDPQPGSRTSPDSVLCLGAREASVLR